MLQNKYRAITAIPNVEMPQVLQIMRGLSSPAILIAVVWSAALVGVGVGPIDFATQPSKAVIALVATGVALFVLASEGGRLVFSHLVAAAARPAPSNGRRC